MNNKKEISVVVPAYRCASCLEELCRRISEAMAGINQDYEIILVNDASPDSDWEIISSIQKSNQNVKGINLSRNFGQHNAIMAGLNQMNGNWCVVMDGDLQDRPEEIANLYNTAKKGYHVVFASRQNRQDAFFKKCNSKLFYSILSYLTDTKLDSSVANFGIYSHEVIENVKKITETVKFFPLCVRWVGFPSTTIAVSHSSRTSGKSSYSFRRLMRLAATVIFAYSNKPLYLIIKLGMVISVSAFFYTIYIFWKAVFFKIPVQGWSSLIASIWFFSGIVILILGLIGIYLGKVFDEVKRRPNYIIKEKI